MTVIGAAIGVHMQVEHPICPATSLCTYDPATERIVLVNSHGELARYMRVHATNKRGWTLQLLPE